jgi:phosphoglycolate phosphatase
MGDGCRDRRTVGAAARAVPARADEPPARADEARPAVLGAAMPAARAGMRGRRARVLSAASGDRVVVGASSVAGQSWHCHRRLAHRHVMTSPLIAAALIDLDGTLVDTLGDFHEALARTLADLGLPAVDRAFVARTVGRGSQYLLARTLEHAGGDASLQAAAWAHYRRHYDAVNGTRAEVYPGVREGLAAMRARGWRLACVTNKPRAFARRLLEAKGLADAFEFVFGGDSFARHKPDPLPLVKACEALGTTPARTLMVGDSRNDCEAARAAGCPVVLVGYGYNHGEPAADARPDRVVDRLDRI